MHTLGYLYCSVECTSAWSWKPSVAAIAMEKNKQLEISTTNYAEPNCTSLSHHPPPATHLFENVHPGTQFSPPV